jgi:signal transduction histidine kinase
MKTVKKFSVENNRRILVIDDNEAIHESYRTILEDDVANAISVDEEETAIFGAALDSSEQELFEVDSAFQGILGLEKVQRASQEGRPYAMAFVDVRMPPGWDGVKTVERIWQVDSELQVVFCTAYSDYTWQEMIQKLGRTDQMLILKKPFDNMEVYQLAHALTKKWHLNRQARIKKEELELRVKERTAELATAYEKLEKTQSQLIQSAKMEVVGRLASGLAHEVKNPLAIIALGLDYFSEEVESDDENIRLSIKRMEIAMKKADDIIKGLLDFSQITELELKAENLCSVIEKTLFLVGHEFDKHHIEVVKEFKEDIPEAEIDRNKIEQVLVNLFLNAARAMSDGGKMKVKIYTKELCEDDEGVGRRNSDIFKPGEKVVVTEVEDTGSGIQEDVLDKIFDPFFTTFKDKGGTGLGLSIVKSIIDMHNGTIEMKNKNDGGAKVTMMLKAFKKGV